MFLVLSHELPFTNYSSIVVLILPYPVIPALHSGLIVLNIAWYTEFCTVLFSYNQGRGELKFIVAN
jgi:hypothetical protein